MINLRSLRKKIRKTIQLLPIFSLIVFSVLSINSPVVSFIEPDVITQNTPKISDVSGSEMYSEQLSAYIVGNASIIKQGYITNDSNILKGFDFNDPAFIQCSVLIASSNGITPQMFPSPFSESAFGSEKFLTYDCFYGFLYYESATASDSTIAGRAERALSIIENLFNIQLFMTETFSKSRFYPFFGFYPNWNDLFEVIINNAPQDGYWGAIDTERLLSESYITQKHISSYILMLDSVEVFTSGFDFPEGFEKFNIDYITTSFADLSAISNVFSGVFELLNFTSGIFTMFDTSELLSSDSKFITTILQYEGMDEGIQKLSENEYSFDLIRALHYNVLEKGPLSPSKKIYISLIGALLTEIDISIFSADILSFTPLYYNFSRYILDSIVEAAFLLGQNIDISIISNYSLRTFWRSNDAVNRIVTNLYDHATLENPINLLTTLSLTGLPLIPTGILEPIEEFNIEYAINSTEPVLRIEKNYRFSSFDTGEYELDITVTNVGEIPAWGKKIEFPVLNQTFLPIPEVITDFIDMQYGMTPEEFLIPDEAPRFIFIDSLGVGIYDHLYPTITNLTQLTFYNPQFAEDILDPIHDDFFNASGVTQEERELLAQLFNQSDSIFNEENWKLDPGEIITYTLGGLTIEPLYNFSSFYDFNFTITGDGLEPYLSYGQILPPSEPLNATTADGTTLDIVSEQIGQDYLIQIYFSFKNTSVIDFYNFSLDQIKLLCQFSSNIELSMDTQFSLEFYNSTKMDFDIIPNSSYSTNNTRIEFTTASHIMDYTDSLKNYQSVFKLTFITNSSQILSIDQIIMQFLDRDLETIMQSPAQVAYTTYTGHNTYFIDSNPIPSVSDSAPILVVFAELDHHNSTIGMINTYNLTIRNIGDLRADDVNITIKAPGIVANSGNFSLIDGYLKSNLSSIDVGITIQNFTFSFYTPNSNNLPLAYVDYNHPITLLNSTHPNYTSYTNDLFLSAPIDCITRFPFQYVLKFYYNCNYTNAHTSWGIAPQVGDIVRLELIVENISPITLSDLDCYVPDNVIGLQRLDNSIAEFTTLEPYLNQSFFTDINKTYWDSILFPGIDTINSSQKYSIQIAKKCPLILAYKSLKIEKSFSDYDGNHNSIIIVQINVTNTGNLELYDITVVDFAGYPKEGFSLVSGTADKMISKIAPNQTYIHTYFLKLNKQGTYIIVPASITYNYIIKQIALSNTFVAKIRNHWIVNSFYVIIPSLVAGIATGLIYWSKKRYDIEAAEFSRREELMFGHDFRSVSWNKRTLQEDLIQIDNNEKMQSKGEQSE